MRITFISDTHNKHKQINGFLPGGDLLIHAGDLTSMGYKHEIQQFCKWYNHLDQYTKKVFIAGNHDWGFQINKRETKEIIDFYTNIDYLEDDLLLVGENYEDMVKIWGSPWQPEFYNWAFNLPKNSDELRKTWDKIPMNTDILITHGPAWGYVDMVIGRTDHLGCELLAERIKVVKPKIHVCGHIHSGYGYKFDGDTHYINASVLNENYVFNNKPLTIDWNRETNEIIFI
jgi:Icc-related predicted phosphoesterase